VWNVTLYDDDDDDDDDYKYCDGAKLWGCIKKIKYEESGEIWLMRSFTE
jgi:hypothetical protein